MAEIKSTLELALERSRKFVLSKEDKEKIRQKEIEEKISRFFYRFGEGRLHLHEIEREIGQMGKEAGEAIKEGLLNRWIEALSLEDGSEKILRGIEWVKHRPIDEVKQEFQELLAQFQSEKERIKQEVRIQLLEGLRREGFSGDAIEPNLEASDLWRRASAELNQTYQHRLEEIKTLLKNL